MHTMLTENPTDNVMLQKKSLKSSNQRTYKMLKFFCEKPSFSPKKHPIMEITILHNRDTLHKVSPVFVFTKVKGIRNIKNVEVFCPPKMH